MISMIRTHKTTEGRLEVLYKHPKLQVMASALAKTPSDITDHLPRYRALTDVAGNPPGFIYISARLTLDDFRDGLEKLQAVAVV